MLRRTLIAAICLSGCYSPSPQSGAYLCGADGACPSNQHCTCGQCVGKDTDAACGFAVSFPGVKGAPTVNEHQPLAVSIQALTASGAPASGFNGTVNLSSSWGDVTPPTLTLAGGALASASITLNRETLPPAVAKLTVAIAGRSTASTGINVVAAPLVPIAPLTITNTWAGHVADASVMKVGADYRMYFAGSGAADTKLGLGVATSADGVTWSGTGTPILSGPSLFSPSVYVTSAGTQMAYTGANGPDIGRALSPDGLQPFVAQTGNLLATSQCGYCAGALSFPQVLPDLTAPVPDGGSPPWLMFFSATDVNSQVSIGRASSPDGINWTPEPAPVLQGNLAGEAVLLSPRVLLDGSVFKMWYSVAGQTNFQTLSCAFVPCPGTLVCNPQKICVAPPTDPFSAFCERGVSVNIGYATSSDGFFWTRSEVNPVLNVDNLSPGDHALLLSSVLPVDGSDPASGVTLYYSIFRHLAVGAANFCAPSGIARATTRP